MSTPPHSRMIWPTASCTASKSVRSAATPSPRTPSRLAATCAAPSAFRSRIATSAPSAASAFAITCPSAAGTAGHDRALALQPHRILRLILTIGPRACSPAARARGLEDDVPSRLVGPRRGQQVDRRRAEVGLAGADRAERHRPRTPRTRCRRSRSRRSRRARRCRVLRRSGGCPGRAGRSPRRSRRGVRAAVATRTRGRLRGRPRSCARARPPLRGRRRPHLGDGLADTLEQAADLADRDRTADERDPAPPQSEQVLPGRAARPQPRPPRPTAGWGRWPAGRAAPRRCHGAGPRSRRSSILSNDAATIPRTPVPLEQRQVAVLAAPGRGASSRRRPRSPSLIACRSMPSATVEKKGLLTSGAMYAMTWLSPRAQLRGRRCSARSRARRSPP